MTSLEMQSHILRTVAARVSEMESEKKHLQNLHAEIGILWRSIGDRIKSLETKIIAEKQSVLPNAKEVTP